MSITAIVENDSIKLPSGVHVPDGTKARIVFEFVDDQSLAERYASLTGSVDQSPEEIAAENEPERAAWLAQSERRLCEGWDNEADDVYNELLAR